MRFQEYKVFENPEKLAEHIGQIWKNLQEQHAEKKPFYLSSPLSSTPLPLYQWAIENAASFSRWDSFRFVLMDEQIEETSENGFSYVALEDSASYERFARKNLLKPLQEKGCLLDRLEDIILKPDLKNLSAFDSLIQAYNGIDLLILAIGVKGHYAQVMPGTSLDIGFHVTKLIPELAQVHTQKGSQSYEGAQFRQYGMSLGHRQVLNAKNIIVMITGEKKQELTRILLSYSNFDQEFPLSIIHHPEVSSKTRVFLSKETLSSRVE